ncbi:hypothetical protein HCX48_00875 [Rhodocyclus tenuis]|uniref:Uncharacterized protein n=1 Tax=Rhodocyclus gracilis TaxID=2929842 RepID=A0ABX0WGG2_9RHOO|nr:hypothetical protein [Rhodocyclus gracilis]NJA87780.1 hypothetical protein [Rhodocyclus gracilis]
MNAINHAEREALLAAAETPAERHLSAQLAHERRQWQGREDVLRQQIARLQQRVETLTRMAAHTAALQRRLARFESGVIFNEMGRRIGELEAALAHLRTLGGAPLDRPQLCP